ncbi:peptidase [Priestia aryabhattai]
MSKRVLILTGDAVEALEVFYPYYRCLEEDIQCTIASPVKKKLQTVVHDFLPEMETFTEKTGYKIDSHASVDEVDPAHFLKENKPLGVICHGQLVLTTVREYLQDREVTAYPACRPEVEAAGAVFVEQTLHVDRNLVTGQAWPDLPKFMKEFFNVLKKAEKVNA